MGVTRRGRRPAATRRGRRLALTRRGRRLVTLAVALLLVGALVLAVTRTPLGALLGIGGGPPCTVSTGQDDVHWSSVQAMTATTVAGVGTRIGASENGVAAAVARALVGDATEPVTPGVAREVYRRLPDVAHPSPTDAALARALLGDRGPALTCTFAVTSGSSLPQQALGRTGLTARAETLRLAMRDVFGPQSLGGFAPGGVRTGHIPGSAHYEGRAIDVFFRPVTPLGTRHGWQLAMWTVAHADQLDLATVIFDRQLWTASRSVQGWRPYRYPGGTDNPILLHEDHVHVDVQRGG